MCPDCLSHATSMILCVILEKLPYENDTNMKYFAQNDSKEKMEIFPKAIHLIPMSESEIPMHLIADNRCILI